MTFYNPLLLLGGACTVLWAWLAANCLTDWHYASAMAFVAALSFALTGCLYAAACGSCAPLSERDTNTISHLLYVTAALVSLATLAFSLSTGADWATALLVCAASLLASYILQWLVLAVSASNRVSHVRQ